MSPYTREMLDSRRGRRYSLEYAKAWQGSPNKSDVVGHSYSARFMEPLPGRSLRLSTDCRVGVLERIPRRIGIAPCARPVIINSTMTPVDKRSIVRRSARSGRLVSNGSRDTQSNHRTSESLLYPIHRIPEARNWRTAKADSAGSPPSAATYGGSRGSGDIKSGHSICKSTTYRQGRTCLFPTVGTNQEIYA